MRHFYKKLSLRNKLLTILLIIIFIFSGFSLFLIQSIDDVSDVTERMSESNLPKLTWYQNWDRELSIKEEMVRNALENGLDTSFIHQYKENHSSREETSLQGDELPQSLEELDNEVQLLDFLIINKVGGLLEYGDEDAAKNVIHTEYLPKMNQLKDQIERGQKAEYDNFYDNVNTFPQIIEKSIWLLVIITVIAIATAIYFSYRISKNITKPIESMADKVDDIASGNYGETVEGSNQVEIEQLTQSINQMSKSLEQSFYTIMKDKQKHEQILNSLPIGIITYDCQSHEYSVNSFVTNLLGITSIDLSSEAISKNLEEQPLIKLFFSEENYHNQKVNMIIHGESYVFLVSQVTLKDEHQLPSGRIFYFIDITETSKLEKRIVQSEKLALVGEMAATSAHEIRNPLTVIYGFMSLMKEALSPQELQRFNFNLMMKEMDRLYSIVEQMLLMSKQKEPEAEFVQVRDVINDLIPLLSNSLHAKDIDFDIQLNDETILADARQLKQVLLNLIRNSMEAIQSNGQIRIYSVISGDQYTLYLEDDGPGVPQEMKSDLFEPFSTSKSNGTGLGLNVVQRIIENHQGTISLYKSDCNGTIFKIELPYVRYQVDAQ